MNEFLVALIFVAVLAALGVGFWCGAVVGYTWSTLDRREREALDQLTCRPSRSSEPSSDSEGTASG